MSLHPSTDLLAPSNDDKNIATVTHLGGTVFSFIPGLIVWILKKDDSAYVADQAKEALNFSNNYFNCQLYRGYFNLANYWLYFVADYLATKCYFLHHGRFGIQQGRGLSLSTLLTFN